MAHTWAHGKKLQTGAPYRTRASTASRDIGGKWTRTRTASNVGTNMRHEHRHRHRRALQARARAKSLESAGKCAQRDWAWTAGAGLHSWHARMWEAGADTRRAQTRDNISGVSATGQDLAPCVRRCAPALRVSRHTPAGLAALHDTHTQTAPCACSH